MDHRCQVDDQRDALGQCGARWEEGSGAAARRAPARSRTPTASGAQALRRARCGRRTRRRARWKTCTTSRRAWAAATSRQTSVSVMPSLELRLDRAAPCRSPGAGPDGTGRVPSPSTGRNCWTRGDPLSGASNDWDRRPIGALPCSVAQRSRALQPGPAPGPSVGDERVGQPVDRPEGGGGLGREPVAGGQGGRGGVADDVAPPGSAQTRTLRGRSSAASGEATMTPVPAAGFPKTTSVVSRSSSPDGAGLGLLVDDGEDLDALGPEQLQQPGHGVGHGAGAASWSPTPAASGDPQPAPATETGLRRRRPARAGPRGCRGGARPSPGPCSGMPIPIGTVEVGSLRHWAHSTTHVRSGRWDDLRMMVLHCRLLRRSLRGKTIASAQPDAKLPFRSATRPAGSPTSSEQRWVRLLRSARRDDQAASCASAGRAMM